MGQPGKEDIIAKWHQSQLMVFWQLLADNTWDTDENGIMFSSSKITFLQVQTLNVREPVYACNFYSL